MTFWERFYNLCLSKGTKPNTVAKELGFSSAVCTQWKKGEQNPSAKKISRLSEYFNVSTDYLLGNTSNSENNIENLDFSLSEEDILHIKKYHELDNYSKRVVDNILDIEYERCLNEKSGIKITTKIAAFGGDNKEIEVSEDNLRKAVSLLEDDDD